MKWTKDRVGMEKVSVHLKVGIYNIYQCVGGYCQPLIDVPPERGVAGVSAGAAQIDQAVPDG